MKDYIEERAIELAEYIIENKATVRSTAKRFNVSKSTVHKDITERLKAQDQLAWVGAMNGIRNRADEIIHAEVIYV